MDGALEASQPPPAAAAQLNRAFDSPFFFHPLPQIAEVYSELGDFDRAVYFLQAEKMFYENALTDMAALAKRVEAAPGEGARQSGAEAGEDGKAREQKDKDKDGDAATSEPTKVGARAPLSGN